MYFACEHTYQEETQYIGKGNFYIYCNFAVVYQCFQ